MPRKPLDADRSDSAYARGQDGGSADALPPQPVRQVRTRGAAEGAAQALDRGRGAWKQRYMTPIVLTWRLALLVYSYFV